MSKLDLFCIFFLNLPSAYTLHSLLKSEKQTTYNLAILSYDIKKPDTSNLKRYPADRSMLLQPLHCAVNQSCHTDRANSFIKNNLWIVCSIIATLI